LANCPANGPLPLRLNKAHHSTPNAPTSRSFWAIKWTAGRVVYEPGWTEPGPT